VLQRARVRRWRRRAGGGALAAIVIVGVGVPLWMLVGLRGSTRTPSSSPPPLVRPAVLQTSIHVPAGAVDLALGAQGVWVSGFGAVSRIDPSTNQVVATVETPGTEDFSQIAVGWGAVWVTADRGAVYRIDATTNRVVATIEVGGTVQGIEAGGGYVWVTRPTEGTGELVRVDPATNRVAGTPIEVGSGPATVVFGFGSLWVTNTSPLSVVRVDPSSGKVTTVEFTGSVAVGYGALWATSDGSVVRADPKTGRPTASIPIARAQTAAVGAGRVWVLASPESSSPTLFYPIQHTAALWEIDPATDRTVGEPVLMDALQPNALAAGDTAVWVADYDSETVTRFDLASQPGPSETPSPPKCGFPRFQPTHLPWLKAGETAPAPHAFYGPTGDSATLYWSRPGVNVPYYVRLTRQSPTLSGSGPGETVDVGIPGAATGELFEGETPGSELIYWSDGQPCSEFVLELAANDMSRAESRAEIIRIASSFRTSSPPITPSG
jgi:hypothetical protein